jgi:hypothetical protein
MKQTLLLAVLILLFLFPCLGQQSRDLKPLYSVQENDKWGFINSKGEIIVPLKYDSVGEFSEGLTYVQFGEHKFSFKNDTISSTGNAKYGYIDNTGKIVIEAKYKWVGDFSEGLAPVSNSDIGKWGFIDTTGKLVIEPKFDGTISPISRTGFSSGMLAVKVNEKYGVNSLFRKNMISH